MKCLKAILWMFSVLTISYGLMALHYDVTANLRDQIKIMENSLQNSFDEHYITRCQLADKNRVPKWQPPKYQFLKKGEKGR